MSEKVLVAWSGGKDSAYALYELLRSGGYEIAALLTTITEGYDRISMHGVRRALLVSQAESLGYPLEEMLIPQECTDQEYERRMGAVLEKYSERGVHGVVFGDLFLEDVRSYREERLERIGMKAIVPLWGMDTGALARAFIDLGFRAVVVCVDAEALEGGFVGREYDSQFLADLPETVDPCGENGEFHTFVYDGPLFTRSVEVVKGKRVLREDRFHYCDLIPFRSGNRQESNQ